METTCHNRNRKRIQIEYNQEEDLFIGEDGSFTYVPTGTVSKTPGTVSIKRAKIREQLLTPELKEQAISLNAGEVAKTIDGHGRRAIFIGTPSGVAVLFDRYQPDDGKPYGWINYQVPGCKKLRWFFGQAGQCNLHQLYQFIEAGNPSSNVGVALSNG